MDETMVNQGMAEWAAEEAKFQFRAALDAITKLGDVLLHVQQGDYKGIIPPEAFADVLFDTDELPLSVNRDAAFLLDDQARRAVQLLEATTGTRVSTFRARAES
jgi:hypothetical protein